MTYGMNGQIALALQNSGGTANVASLHHFAFLSEDFARVNIGKGFSHGWSQW